MKERNISPIGYYRKKNHKYREEGRENRRSQSRSPIKGLTSTARTESNRSAVKGRRNYRYVD